MAGVGCTGAATAPADLKAVLLYDVIEVVVADTVPLSEALAVHVPQLVAAYAGVKRTYLADELNNEALETKTEKAAVLVLVIGLLAYTKQPADGRDAVERGSRAAKPSCHLVPAFFRSMP